MELLLNVLPAAALAVAVTLIVRRGLREGTIRRDPAGRKFHLGPPRQ